MAKIKRTSILAAWERGHKNSPNRMEGWGNLLWQERLGQGDCRFNLTSDESLKRTGSTNPFCLSSMGFIRWKGNVPLVDKYSQERLHSKGSLAKWSRTYFGGSLYQLERCERCIAPMTFARRSGNWCSKLAIKRAVSWRLVTPSAGQALFTTGSAWRRAADRIAVSSVKIKGRTIQRSLRERYVFGEKQESFPP